MHRRSVRCTKVYAEFSRDDGVAADVGKPLRHETDGGAAVGGGGPALTVLESVCYNLF